MSFAKAAVDEDPNAITVLVVDDEQANLESLEKVFVREGMRVLSAPARAICQKPPAAWGSAAIRFIANCGTDPRERGGSVAGAGLY